MSGKPNVTNRPVTNVPVTNEPKSVVLPDNELTEPFPPEASDSFENDTATNVPATNVPATNEPVTNASVTNLPATSGSGVPRFAGEFRVTKAPEIILAEAHRAAKALSNVVSSKKKRVIIGGEQYLEFQDWATVAAFYQHAVIIREDRYITMPGGVYGYEAIADVYDPGGRVVATGVGMCLNSEEHWGSRPVFEWKTIGGERIKVKVGEQSVPLHQIRSMAQTRACCRALKLRFSWVVVLAGYSPTPAEEVLGTPLISESRVESRVESREDPGMEGVQQDLPHGKSESRSGSETAAGSPPGKATEKQIRLIHVLLKRAGFPTEQERKDFATGFFSKTVEHFHALSFKEASRLIDHVQAMLRRQGPSGEEELF